MLDNYFPKPVYLSLVQLELLNSYCTILGYQLIQMDNGVRYIEYKTNRYYIDYVGGILYCFHKSKHVWNYLNLQEAFMMMKKIMKQSDVSIKDITEKPQNASLYKICCGLI